ncbi:MAG: HAD-IIIC family phosphatase [Kineosporiaceae bacterium]|nr:HAD-IIIC family phosphatase [Kineosporiaceae bacterium]MBK7622424.1 HAD-IIIC family phosphatase [Kineosporiaceae bacterium]MBK8075488.1 HAD-IIIC family phosphatase [Kineosporiaceae bacterium]
MTPGAEVQGRIKCIVWDLDNTVWDGILLEGDPCTVRPGVRETLEELDRRGILHSIASRNDAEAALSRLREVGMLDYFLFPQISWNAKSDSVRRIAGALSFGLDALAFADDQEFERAEVAHAHADVLCLDPTDPTCWLDLPEFTPRFVTEESRHRRELYRSQLARDESEQQFEGTNQEFLSGLGMVFSIRRANRSDLQRAEELTVRTNQLNSTGRTYTYDELDALVHEPDHLLLVADLEDRFGSYGTIGLALVELGSPAWHLRLLLMSCRTMSRGVGTILLNHIMDLALQAGVRLRADLIETGRNRLMQITYAFAGFVEVEREGAHVVLESDLALVQKPADYVEVRVS